MTAAESEDAQGECVAIVDDGENHVLQLNPPSHVSDSKPTTHAFDWIVSNTFGQQEFYDLHGHRVVQGVTEGFHGCVFAYGQTGSGKSYTVFGGTGDERGLFPRICENLFLALEEDHGEYLVRLSYLEIYKERLRDLLHPAKDDVHNHSLEIRTHPKVGVFVENLTSNCVSNMTDVSRLLRFGHHVRVVGSTHMNDSSSRSHAVVTLNLERTVTLASSAQKVKRRANFHCVDLAGSERYSQVGESKERQAETKVINTSLLALSLTISRLAEEGSKAHIPYRNSKLTYLLSESLMGNCKTLMVACASPASSSFMQTESTIRFASSVKTITTKPMKNEEIEGQLVENLRAEIEALRRQLEGGTSSADDHSSLTELLMTSQVLEQMLGKTWEQQVAQSKAFDDERNATLMRLGLTSEHIAEAWKRGEKLHTRSDADPYLVNLCDDPLLTGALTVSLTPDREFRLGSDPTASIQLNGAGIRAEMCALVNSNGKVQLKPLTDLAKLTAETSPSASSRRLGVAPALARSSGVSLIYLNNKMVLSSATMQHGDRLRIGQSHVFQLFVPEVEHDLDLAEAVTSCAEDDVAYFTSDGSSDRHMANELAGYLKDRIGSERTDQLFHRVREIKPFIDEANLLNEELLGDEDYEYVFNPHLLTGVVTADMAPELGVVLYKIRNADDIDIAGKPIFQTEDPPTQLLAVWSESVFMSRLDVIRDLHHFVSERGKPWGEEGDADPWSDVQGMATVSTLLSKTRKSRRSAFSSSSDEEGRQSRGLNETSGRRVLGEAPPVAQIDTPSFCVPQAVTCHVESGTVREIPATSHQNEASTECPEVEQLRTMLGQVDKTKDALVGMLQTEVDRTRKELVAREAEASQQAQKLAESDRRMQAQAVELEQLRADLDLQRPQYTREAPSIMAPPPAPASPEQTAPAPGSPSMVARWSKMSLRSSSPRQLVSKGSAPKISSLKYPMATPGSPQLRSSSPRELTRSVDSLASSSGNVPLLPLVRSPRAMSHVLRASASTGRILTTPHFPVSISPQRPTSVSRDRAMRFHALDREQPRKTRSVGAEEWLAGQKQGITAEIRRLQQELEMLEGL